MLDVSRVSKPWLVVAILSKWARQAGSATRIAQRDLKRIPGTCIFADIFVKADQLLADIGAAIAELEYQPADADGVSSIGASAESVELKSGTDARDSCNAASVRRTQVPDPSDEDEAEVSLRLGMARPVLAQLVKAGKARSSMSITGNSKTWRNYGLHSELGCGPNNLPLDAKEARQRMLREASGCKPAMAEPQDAPSFSSSELEDDSEQSKMDHSFNMRFKQALRAADAPALDQTKLDDDKITLLAQRVATFVVEAMPPKQQTSVSSLLQPSHAPGIWLENGSADAVTEKSARGT